MVNLNQIKYFVFCCGKTGSSSLVKSLQHYFGFNSTIQVHGNNQFQEFYKKNENICDVIKNNSKKFDKIYIIDSYREPFERAVASFFQNIDFHYPEWRLKSIDEIIEYFNSKNFILLDRYHSYYESWACFDISTDIEFDFDKGYVLIEKDNMIFIKTRLNESYRWSQIFSKILNNNIKITENNNSKEKPYYRQYEQFKKKYILPNETKKQFLEVINNTSNQNNPFHITWIEMNKFMTKNEINEYIKKWL